MLAELGAGLGGGRSAASRSLRSMASRLRPDVHVGCTSEAGVLRRRGRSAALEGALRVAEAALGDLDVGQRERAAHDVRQVVAGLEAGDRLGVALAGRPSRSPRVQCARPSSAAAAPRWSRSSSPARSRTRVGVADGGVDVAGEQGQPGSVHGGHGGKTGERLLVEDDRGIVGGRASDSTMLEQRFEPGRVAGGHAGADEGHGEHRSVDEEVGGQGLEPAPQLRLLAGPLHRRRGPLDQLRGTIRGRRPPGRGRSASSGSPLAAYQSLARRCSSGTRSACSSRSRARSTSPKRWWYRYQVRRSSRATRNRFDRSRCSRVALASSTPVTAAHSGPVSRLEDRRVEQEVPDLRASGARGPRRRGSRG